MITINKNEKQLVEELCDINPNVYKAQQYIKENYNVDSEYNEDSSELHLINGKPINIIEANEYLKSHIDNSVSIIY